MVICRARGMIVDDNKILLVRHKNSNFYALPWWKVEENESVEDAVTRELFEEIWVSPLWIHLVGLQNFFGWWTIGNIDFMYWIDNAVDYKDLSHAVNSSHSFEWEKLERVDLDDDSVDIKPKRLQKLAKNISAQWIKDFIIEMPLER